MNSKIDTRALKARHRLELVMQETGELFEIDHPNPGLWTSSTTRGLMVDLNSQTFTITRPGLEDVIGDVYAWLRRRYSWTFPQAVKYLQKRAADPKPKDEPKPAGVKASAPPIVMRAAAPSWAGEADLDPWQLKALKIGGDGIRELFRWEWMQLFNLLMRLPWLYIPVAALGVEKCGECGAQFNWQDPGTRGYLPLGRELGMEISEDVFEDIICEDCKTRRTNHFYAIEYCMRSARNRPEEPGED